MILFDEMKNRYGSGQWTADRSRKTNDERIHEDASINKRTRLNPLLYSLEDHFPPQRDSDMSTSHQSNGQDSCGQSSQSKLHEEFANLLKPVSIGNNHLQQCLPSSPLKKQRTDSTQNHVNAIQRTTDKCRPTKRKARICE